MSASPIVIIGAGLTGLSAAYHLERRGMHDYVVLDAGTRAGGLARTEHDDGFAFDHSIHILYTRDAYAAELIHELLGDNIGKQQRRSFCFTEGRYTEYPYQAYNYGLPPEVVADNILGLIAARESSTHGPAPRHYEDWILRTFGQGIAQHFMLPYNRKQWAWDLTDMSYGWIADRVPVPDIRDVLLGALRPPVAAVGPNHEFWYPLTGGIESLVHGFTARVPAERLRLSTRVASIDGHAKVLVTDRGERMPYRQVISTVPLRRLLPMLTNVVPPDIAEAAHALKHNVVHTVNIGLAGPELGQAGTMHWVYYPGSDTVFHRLSFPHTFSAAMTPDGCASIQAEISESPHKAIDRTRLVADTLEGLVRVGLLTEAESRSVADGGRVMTARVVTLDPAYIIYDHRHRTSIPSIRGYLEPLGIQTCGRFGDWEYFNMDASMLAGRRASEAALAAVG